MNVHLQSITGHMIYRPVHALKPGMLLYSVIPKHTQKNLPWATWKHFLTRTNSNRSAFENSQKPIKDCYERSLTVLNIAKKKKPHQIFRNHNFCDVRKPLHIAERRWVLEFYLAPRRTFWFMNSKM